MANDAEADPNNGPLSPETTSASEAELPDANLLTRQKRQLAAAAQRRKSSNHAPTSSGSNSRAHNNGVNTLENLHEIANQQGACSHTGNDAPGNGLTERRFSWRQHWDDAISRRRRESEGIPQAEWAIKGRRPSWRRTTDEIDADQGEDPPQPLMELATVGGKESGRQLEDAEAISGGVAAGVLDLDAGLLLAKASETVLVKVGVVGTGRSAAVVSKSVRESGNISGRAQVAEEAPEAVCRALGEVAADDLLEHSKSENAAFGRAGQDLRAPNNARLEKTGSSVGLTEGASISGAENFDVAANRQRALPMKTQTVSGQYEQRGNREGGCAAAAGDTVGQDTQLVAGKRSADGRALTGRLELDLSTATAVVGETQHGRRACNDGESGPESMIDGRTDGAQQVRNNSELKQAESKVAGLIKGEMEGRSSGSFRRRVSNIAELKRLAAVEAPGRGLRRRSEGDVVKSEVIKRAVLEGDVIGSDVSKRDVVKGGVSEGDINSGQMRRGTLPDESEKGVRSVEVCQSVNAKSGGWEGGCDETIVTPKVVGSRLEEGGWIAAQDGRSQREATPEVLGKTETTSGKFGSKGGLVLQVSAGAVRMGLTTETEDSAVRQKRRQSDGTDVRQKGRQSDATDVREKRRTSATLLRGNWLAKAKEIGMHRECVGERGGGLVGQPMQGAGDDSSGKVGVREEAAVVTQTETARMEVGGSKSESVGRSPTKARCVHGGSAHEETPGQNGRGSILARGSSAKKELSGDTMKEEKTRDGVASLTGVKNPASVVLVEKTLQDRVRAEVDTAVQSAIAAWQEKLLDQTRILVSREMARVHGEFKQTGNGVGEVSKGVKADSKDSEGLEALRCELGRVKQDLARVKREVKKDLEEGLSAVRDELAEVVGETGGLITEVREKLEVDFTSVRERIEDMRTEYGQEARNERGPETAEEFGAGSEPRNRASLESAKMTANVKQIVASNTDLEARVSALESRKLEAGDSQGLERKEGPPALAERTERIESDLKKLRQEVSEMRELASGLQEDVAETKGHVSGLHVGASEMGAHVYELKASVASVRQLAENDLARAHSDAAAAKGLVGGLADALTQVENLRTDLGRGLASRDTRIDQLDRDMRERERMLAQKVAQLAGTCTGMLEVAEDRLPSPAAKNAEAVASASKRTEDQLARVEERIGLMLGLVSRGATDAPVAPGPKEPLDVFEAIGSLVRRLESLEKQSAETVPSAEGLVTRMEAVEATLRVLEIEGKTESWARNSEPSISAASKTVRKSSDTRAHDYVSLEPRVSLLEQLLSLETGLVCSSGFPRNHKPSNPLSPKSPNRLSNPPLSPQAVRAFSPKPVNPQKLASLEGRLGGLEARLNALTDREASGAAAMGDMRVRVQGLDKRVQGLHQNMDLKGELSRRVAAAEWRLEQIASLVITNTRALEAQVERAQEDCGLAKDAADLASGKCGALAAEFVKLNRQLTAVTREKQVLASAG